MTLAWWLSVAALVGLLAVELARSIPAWLRVKRSRSAAGLSATATGVLAGSATGWIAVALLSAAWPALVATVVWLIFHLLLCAELRTVSRPMFVRMVKAAAVSQLAVIVVGAVGFAIGHPAETLGAAIGAATLAHALPALVTGMTSSSTAGLSIPALAVNSLEGVAYTVGGLGLGGVAPVGVFVLGYVLSGSALLLTNVPRLIRVTYRRSARLDVAAA